MEKVKGITMRGVKRRFNVKKRKRRLAIAGILIFCIATIWLLATRQTEQNKILTSGRAENKPSAVQTETSASSEKKEIATSTSPTQKDIAKSTVAGTSNTKKTVPITKKGNAQSASSSPATSKDTHPQNNKPQPKNTNYSQVFKKDIFIGDSITEGMSDFDFLDEDNVCAKLGLNLNTIDQQIEKAQIMKPERIFLLVGSNDIEDDGTTPEAFKKKYADVIRKIKKSILGVKIYVQSILPVLPQVTQKHPIVNNDRVGKFNSAIQAMAKEENISYINIASLVNDSSKKLYEPDGQHFKSQFYNLWLDYLELNTK